jgi:hypothetical protein
MKNGTQYRLLLAAVCIGAALFAGCPQDEPATDDPTDNPDTPEWEIEYRDTTKLNTKGQRVVHTMWGEPEEDPRQVIGYQLDDENGTPFFDHYVMLYGFRLRDHDCTKDTSLCNKTGLHLHFMDNVQRYYVDQYDKYIKPVRDRGIKVIFSIVPNDDGVCVGSLYRWPSESTASWYSIYGQTYPFGEIAVAGLIQQIKEFYELHPFDGIAYDEEYGNQKDGPKPGKGEIYSNTSTMGENLLRFAWELETALGLDDPGKFTQEVYEIRTGTSIPASYTFTPTGGTAITVNRQDILDYYFESTYGGWQVNPANSGVDRAHYGPASIAICDVTGGPRPPVGYPGPGVQQRMEAHLRGNYGVVMYYCLRSRDEMKMRFANHFGADNPSVDIYLSQISQALHGKKTIYVGPDYARVWWWD